MSTSSHEEKLRARRELSRDMYEKSGDPSGSDPSSYLAAEDVQLLSQFVELANAASWPHATTFDLKSPWSPLGVLGVKAWRKPTDTGKSWLKRDFVMHRIGGTHQGYVFGQLSTRPSQGVAICDDGLLRSHRGPELARSNGYGWGALPKPELLLSNLDKGQIYPVNYKDNVPSSLLEILSDRSKGEVLQFAADHGVVFPPPSPDVR